MSLTRSISVLLILASGLSAQQVRIPGPGGSAPASGSSSFVNADSLYSNSGTNSRATTTGINVTSGNVLIGYGMVALVDCTTITSMTMVDSGSAVTMTLVGSLYDNAHAQAACIGVFKGVASSNATADTFTVTFNTTTNFAAVGIIQFNSFPATTDVTAQGGSATSTPVTSGSFTPTSTTGVSVAGCLADNSGVTWTADTGYTIPSGAANGILAMEYKLNPAASSQTVGCTSSISVQGVISAITLKH